MIAAKYSLTKEDYISYYLYVMWDAPDRKKARVKYYLRQVLINAGIILLLTYVDVFRYSHITLYIYIGILAIVTAMQLLNARYNVKRQAQKLVDSEDNQSFFLEAQVEISESGIARKDENEETKYQWKAFIKKQETPEYYFLFTSSIQAFIVPKRILKTTDEKQQFDRLLLHYLSFEAELGNLVD